MNPDAGARLSMTEVVNHPWLHNISAVGRTTHAYCGDSEATGRGVVKAGLWSHTPDACGGSVHCDSDDVVSVSSASIGAAASVGRASDSDSDGEYGTIVSVGSEALGSECGFGSATGTPTSVVIGAPKV